MDDRRVQDLIADSRGLLEEFLKTDLKLGLGFAHTALEEADSARRDRLRESANRVAETVVYFLPRLSAAARHEIELKFAELERLLH